MKKFVTALGALAVLATATSAQAGVIFQPKSVTVQIGGELLGSAAINMINQSGLSTTYVSGVTDFDSYMGLNPLHAVAADGEWLSTGPRTMARVTFDLGEEVEFNGFAVWNEDSTSMTSIIASIPLGGSFIGMGTPYQNPLGQAYGPTVRMHQLIKSRYVTFDVYGCNQAGFSHNGCGLGEVAFRSTAAAPPPPAGIPEPATWAMMIVGFGAAGTALRNRRRRYMAA